MRCYCVCVSSWSVAMNPMIPWMIFLMISWNEPEQMILHCLFSWMNGRTGDGETTDSPLSAAGNALPGPALIALLHEGICDP